MRTVRKPPCRQRNLRTRCTPLTRPKWALRIGIATGVRHPARRQSPTSLASVEAAAQRLANVPTRKLPDGRARRGRLNSPPGSISRQGRYNRRNRHYH